jgi:hypothetical protein
MARSLPAYASCSCGEYHQAALRRPDGRRCYNCADTRPRRGLCLVCEQSGPLQDHHPGGWRHCLICWPNCSRTCPHTIPACLNCHRVLSQWQYRWHPAWRTTGRLETTVLFSVQGLLDMAQLRHNKMPAGDWRASPIALVLYALRLALRCWLPGVSVNFDCLVMPDGCLVTSVDR